MKTIGIIGGMGPEATLDLFRKMIQATPAEKDQDHVHVVIDNYPAIPDRTAFLLGKGIDPTPFLVESARRLATCGVDFLCMPCNTAHYFQDAIKAQVSVPMISIVESALNAVVSSQPNAKTVGLLATQGAFIGRVYHDLFEKAGLSILEVPAAVQEKVMAVIYAVKAGKGDSMLSQLQEAVDALQEMGAEVLIGGCTEIPLVIPKVICAVPVIDPTLELALAAVRAAKETAVTA